MFHALWYSLGMTLYLGCQWLLSILVVHLSGYADAGDLSIAMTVSNVFSMAALFGVRNFQVSDIRDEIPGSIYVTARVVTTAIAYLALIFFVLAGGYGRTTACVILLYCLFRVSEAAVDVFHGIDQKKGRLDAVGKSHAMRGVVFLLVFVVILYLGGSLSTAILAMTAAVFLFVLFYDYPIANKLTPFRIDWNWGQILGLLKQCTPLVVYALMLSITGLIPRYFLERMDGSEALGFYASVATPTLIVQVAASYLFNPMIPSFSEALLEGNKKRFSQLFQKVNMFIAGLAVAALLGGKFLGGYLLTLLFDAEILPYVYLLDLAILCTILTAYVWFLCTVLTVLRGNKALVLANGIALMVCALVSAPAIQRFSLQGVNYSNLIALGVNCLILFICYRKNVRKRFGTGRGN